MNCKKHLDFSFQIGYNEVTQKFIFDFGEVLMKRKKISAILTAVILAFALCGCSVGEPSVSETSSDGQSSSISAPQSSVVFSSSSPAAVSSENPDDTSSSSTESSAEQSAVSGISSSASSKAASSSRPNEDISVSLIPEAVQTARVEGDRIIFSVENIFANNGYYRVDISGAKCANQSAAVGDDTTYVNGVLYGDFRLDLYKQGIFIDSLKINVPRDDSFLILENASIGKDYGCSLMSHKREFSIDKYPDIIRLEFFHQRGTAVPQYARYFAIFDNKIQELKIFENGVEVSPTGTFLTMEGDGLMTQHLTIETYYQYYNVHKYEYRFNLEKRRLDKKEIDFTGWGN